MVISDQIGNKISFDKPFKRVVSLVPSQTELIYDLGVSDSIIGLTRFCIYPEHLRREKVRIGGTKDFRVEQILELAPDLIIANKEENDQERVEELAEHVPVYTSDIKNLEDALEMIKDVANLLGCNAEGEKIYTQIVENFNTLKVNQDTKQLLKVAYFVWKEPMMVAGGDTFISKMIESAGFINVFSGLDRYPTISEQQLLEAHPDLILLSSEPYPFKDKDIVFFKENFKLNNVRLVDGTFFSWYGSRLWKAPGYFKDLITNLD